ncbi:MAG TPA: hypothetical protein VEL47_01465, partial [Myxococcota bacterium]|nr:hypothetical protein [Myxococcota bacterium]
MNDFIYWPYDEVSLDIKTQGKLVVKTPWMEATTSSLPFDVFGLSELSRKLNENDLSHDDIGMVSDFFSYFHQYPLAYVLPTNKTSSGLDTHAIKDSSILQMSFEDLLCSILNVNKGEIESLFAVLPRRDFAWDTEAAINFAGVDDRVHPESLLSVARRYHILELMANDSGSDVFNNIRKEGEEQFRTSIARVVRQNHYVTEHCMASLRPALCIAGQALPMVEDFMQAERGHDKILKKALFFLGTTPEEIEVSLQTRVLMAVLGYVAGRNFLAFAMAVDAFERNNFAEIDP